MLILVFKWFFLASFLFLVYCAVASFIISFISTCSISFPFIVVPILFVLFYSYLVTFYIYFDLLCCSSQFLFQIFAKPLFWLGKKFFIINTSLSENLWSLFFMNETIIEHRIFNTLLAKRTIDPLHASSFSRSFLPYLFWQRCLLQLGQDMSFDLISFRPACR